MSLCIKLCIEEVEDLAYIVMVDIDNNLISWLDG